MVNLDEYFCVWKQRLMALKGSSNKIRLLSSDAQFMQALLVRNSCLDFVTELESAFESILCDYVCRQDEFFLAAVDDIHLSAFSRKPWPLDSDLANRIAEQKEGLAKSVKSWAVQAAEFEAKILLVQEGYKREAYAIIGELTVVYGVSPRIRKKKNP